MGVPTYGAIILDETLDNVSKTCYDAMHCYIRNSSSIFHFFFVQIVRGFLISY